MTNEELTKIYNEANGITIKNPPLTTDRIFVAMRACYELGRKSKQLLSEAEQIVILPCARLHINATDTYLHAEVEVLDGTFLQPEMSPVDVYTTPQSR